jgi:hypothetical protein
MKKLILVLVSILLITSCVSKKTITLTNGKKITERKADRMMMRGLKKCLKELSKDDRDIIMGMSVDTTNVIGN